MPNDTPDSQSSGATGESQDGGVTAPTPADASGYGITLTLVGAVLLALAYYGVLAIQGPRELGQALPVPFYGLAVAFLFVIELLQRRTLTVVTISRAIALAAGYGALFILAVEGGAYLWERPAVALEGYAGVTVFAVSLVVAALLYVGYLTLLEADRRPAE